VAAIAIAVIAGVMFDALSVYVLFSALAWRKLPIRREWGPKCRAGSSFYITQTFLDHQKSDHQLSDFTMINFQ
jgi:hypothetical protein